MTYYPDEDNTLADEYGEPWEDDGHEGGSDEHTEDIDDEHEDWYSSRDPDDRSFEPIQWAKLKLGKTVINVCSTGIVRREGDPFYHVTSGVTLVGSPYRYIVVETEDDVFEKFFMHELVWKAFNGEVPNHWEVRHKAWVPLEHNREYPNDLYCVEIYPKISAPYNGW
jgi:hypothetical protein